MRGRVAPVAGRRHPAADHRAEPADEARDERGQRPAGRRPVDAERVVERPIARTDAREGERAAVVVGPWWDPHATALGAASNCCARRSSANFGGAIVAFVADAVVTIAVSLVTRPKPEHELSGLVWGLPRDRREDDFLRGDNAWYRSPLLLGTGALVLVVALNIV
jgi:hypothetical protein